MAITVADVEYVAKLSKLEIPEAEKAAVAEKLAAILDYMQQLQEVDTANIEPTTHVLPLTNVLRADQVGECLPHQEAVGNAPDYHEGYFRVPRIL